MTLLFKQVQWSTESLICPTAPSRRWQGQTCASQQAKSVVCALHQCALLSCWIVTRPRMSGELMTENCPLDLVIRKLMGVLFQENFREQIRMAPDCSWFKEKINYEEIEKLRKTWFWVKGTVRERVVAEWDAGSQGASVPLFCKEDDWNLFLAWNVEAEEKREKWLSQVPKGNERNKRYLSLIQLCRVKILSCAKPCG